MTLSGLSALLRPSSAPAQNGVHDALSRLGGAFPGGEAAPSGGAPKSVASAAINCLRPALEAAAWSGHERHIQEALPHFDAVEDIDGLRAVLGRLHFDTEPLGSRTLQQLTARDLPCLFATTETDVMVVKAFADDGRLLIHDGATGEETPHTPSALSGQAYRLQQHDVTDTEQFMNRTGWIGYVVGRFKPLIGQVFVLSLFVNLTALVIPLFVMHVYDFGIGAKSHQAVWALAIGAGLVIALDLALRLLRSQAMAYFGARFDALLGTAAFQQLLYMPVGMTENAPISAQVTRLKQFESLRDVFTGTLASAIVDIPFMILFLIVIAIIGGHLVWVPATLMVVYVLMAAVTIPLTKLHVGRSGESKQRAHDLAMEMLTKRSAIRDVHAEDMFLARFAREQQDYALRNFKAQQFNGLVQNLSQTLVNVAGVGTLALGSVWVMNGAMTLGALISAMTLVWRVLSPLQQSFLSLSRLQQSASTFTQVNKLMQMKLERKPGVMPSFLRKFEGNLSLVRLILRYPNRPEPALKGLSLTIKAGEVIAITGPSGAGKTTLLRAIAGLYPLQGGAVMVDGLDIRQIDPAEWRGAIGFVPDTPTFFYGTIAQNMRLGCPEATDEDLERAAEDVGLWDHRALLPQGLETRLTAKLLRDLPDDLIQRIMLARGFCRNGRIVLMDQPTTSLDRTGDLALQRKIAALRGQATVIFTTHRPSHMKLADRLVVLDQGVVALDGPPEKVMERMPEFAA